MWSLFHCRSLFVLLLIDNSHAELPYPPHQLIHFDGFDIPSNWIEVQQGSGIIWLQSSDNDCQKLGGGNCLELKGNAQVKQSISTVGYHTIIIVIDVRSYDLEPNKDSCYLSYSGSGTTNTIVVATRGASIDETKFNVSIPLPDTDHFNDANLIDISLGTSSISNPDIDHCFFDSLSIYGIPYTKNPTFDPTKQPTNYPTPSPTNDSAIITGFPTPTPSERPTSDPTQTVYNENRCDHCQDPTSPKKTTEIPQETINKNIPQNNNIIILCVLLLFAVIVTLILCVKYRKKPHGPGHNKAVRTSVVKFVRKAGESKGGMDELPMTAEGDGVRPSIINDVSISDADDLCDVKTITTANYAKTKTSDVGDGDIDHIEGGNEPIQNMTPYI